MTGKLNPNRQHFRQGIALPYFNVYYNSFIRNLDSCNETNTDYTVLSISGLTGNVWQRNKSGQPHLLLYSVSRSICILIRRAYCIFLQNILLPSTNEITYFRYSCITMLTKPDFPFRILAKNYNRSPNDKCSIFRGASENITYYQQ